MPVYMEIDGITGTAKGNYRGFIRLESCNLARDFSVGSRAGRVNSKSTGPADSGVVVPNVREIVVTKLQDETTPILLQHARNGTGKQGTIMFTKSETDMPYMVVLLKNVQIGGMIGSVESQGKKQLEILTLNAERIIIHHMGAASGNERNQWQEWFSAAVRGS